MRQRILSTALLWLLVILLPVLLGVHGGFLLVLIFALLTQWEINEMQDSSGTQPLPLLGATVATAMIAGVAYWPRFGLGEAMAFGVVVIGLVSLFTKPYGVMLKRFVPTVTALLVGPFMLAFYIPLMQQSLLLAVWVIAVTKFTDVGGLLVGMWLGKNKMAPQFSPKKTWEGAAGGVAASVVVGMLIHTIGREWLPTDFTLLKAILIAPVLAVVGICADLFESAWKREVGIKDTGKLFPGIGGAFDLTDSILFAAPVAVILLALA